MDEVSKILTSKKKRSKCRHKPPSEICKFSPYASEKSHTSKDADRLNPSETTLGSPCGKIHRLGGGLDIKRECTQRQGAILAAGIELD
jgi:hypothetical protein